MDIVWLIIGLVVGGGGATAFFTTSAAGVVKRAKAEAELLKATALREAEGRSREIELGARNDVLKRKEAFEKEVAQERDDLKNLEQRLAKRED
ncbi:MAG TPA: Rnase Y domain-containing protein, partial [Tepidisphaeraceae bacterium]|nr:Rnase Y domain-containing protein [Tepidisphaeraceae bacterium]